MYAFNNANIYQQGAPNSDSTSTTCIPNISDQFNNWQCTIPSAPYEDCVKNEATDQLMLAGPSESDMKCVERPSNFPTNLKTENSFGYQFNNNNDVLSLTDIDKSTFSPYVYNNYFSPAVSGNIPSYNQSISSFYNAQNQACPQQYPNDIVNSSYPMMPTSPKFYQYPENMHANQPSEQNFVKHPSFFNFDGNTDSRTTIDTEPFKNQENESQSTEEDDNTDVVSEKCDTEAIDLTEIKSQLCRMENEIKHLNEMLNDRESTNENCDGSIETSSSASDQNNNFEQDDHERDDNGEEDENSDESDDGSY